MPRWSDIRIGRRILLGFGFAALLTLIVAGVSIYYLGNVGQRLTLVAEHDQLLLTSALELQVAVEQESDGIRGYLLSDDQSFLEPFTTGQSHYSETATRLEDLVQSDEDKGLLSDINKSHSDFVKIAEEEIALHGHGFPQSAIFLWQKQGNEIKSDLHSKITSFIDRQEGIISENTQQARNDQNQALAIALILVVVAWVAGMGGGIWISRSITRPIRSLVSAAEAIGKGDLATRTSIPGTDELASLGSTMNQMVRDLAQSRETTERLTAQLHDLVDSLEQRVADRTRELEELEHLGRAIINAPPDASTLSELLTAHVPSMFLQSRIEIRSFPDLTILHHPTDWTPVPDSIWEWLRTADEAQCFLPGATLPWGDKPLDNDALVIAPIADPRSGETIGGIYVLGHRNSTDVASLLPVVKTLAAQIAGALNSARVYCETLAHQKVEQELTLAGQIQASFLPDHLPQIAGWQLSATLKPARETSGDYYDFIPLPEGRLGILVADVTDKGLGAALYMALCHTLIRTSAEAYDTRPDMVFNVTNRRILEDARGNLLVTVFYGVLNPDSGTLTYCNAGHNPPYLISARHSDAVQTLDRTGLPLGAFEDTTWEQKIVEIAPADTLLLYTDGVTDAQNGQEEFFGKERLLEVAQANLGRSAQEVQDAVIAAVDEFVVDSPQFDDITLMVVVRGLTEAEGNL